MAYLVRKLNKRDKLCVAYKTTESIEDIYADIPTAEFRTSEGNLSTWRIESLQDIEKAILAIAITSSRIEKMDVIVIDISLLDSIKLDYKKTYAGQDIAIPELQDLHYDITGITLSSLSKCAEIYQKIVILDNDEGKYILRIAAGEIRDKLEKAVAEGKVNVELAEGKIKDEIEKIMK